MAVISVLEEWNGRQGNQVEQDGEVAIERTFKARTNNTLDDSVVILAHALVPKIFDPHPNFASSLCREVRAVQESPSPLAWTVTARYSTQGLEDENPLLRAPVFTWGSQQREAAAEFDKESGNPIQNTAGDSFDPPLPQEIFDLTLDVRRNEAVFNPLTINTYVNTVNLTTWHTFPPRTVKCNEIGATSEFDENLLLSYWSVSYRFALRLVQTFDLTDPGNPILLPLDGWDQLVLNAGFAFLNGDGNLQVILDDAGTPVNIARPLDAVGGILDPDGPLEPFYLRFRIYTRSEFAGLLIPQPF